VLKTTTRERLSSIFLSSSPQKICLKNVSISSMAMTSTHLPSRDQAHQQLSPPGVVAGVVAPRFGRDMVVCPSPLRDCEWIVEENLMNQMIEEGKGATRSVNDDGATASREANGSGVDNYLHNDRSNERPVE
jgi:hypothetical protein